MTLLPYSPFDNERAAKHMFLQDILLNFPRLRKFEIIQGCILPTPTFFNSLLKCPNLEVLKTSRCHFQGGTTESYMRSASVNKLKLLSSKDDTFYRTLPFRDDLKFPELQHLEIIHDDDMAIETQLEWISRCPNLKSFRWESSSSLPVNKFCQTIPTACPNLVSLHLYLEIYDVDIASIIDAVPRIEELSIQCNFETVSMNALRRHFSWLSKIDIRYGGMMTSPMIQEILCSCPALNSFTANMLHYRDVVARPQDWVCKNLQVFDVGVTFIGVITRPPSWHRIRAEQALVLNKREKERLSRAHRDIYNRIAQLTDLRHLNICRRNVGILYEEEVFKVSLESGLEALSTLKRLKSFSCSNIFAHLRKDEVSDALKWMAEHWRNLETLGDCSRKNPVFGSKVWDKHADKKRLLRFLKDRGVELEEDFDFETTMIIINDTWHKTFKLSSS
ncbi:hypothetical protein BGX28_004236 [Mortierella sp. GBA30]|nr:hypothetical protein BGX28_004236 [Mortierella sp. GBA30]